MTTEPLANGQHLILERLMASHVLDDDEAKALFRQHVGGQGSDGGGSRSLEECWKEINRQLSKGFGLEIATVSWRGRRHHAVVNLHVDDIAKQSFSSSLNPHGRAYVRVVLEHLVASSNRGDRHDDDDGDGEDHDDRHDDNGRQSGGGGGENHAAARMDLINLRTRLPEPHKTLSRPEAEVCLDALLEEKWLCQVQDDDDDDDDDGDDDDGGGGHGRRGRRKKDRRRTVMSREYTIGPRTYLELPHLLRDFGLEDPPQTIFHRG